MMRLGLLLLLAAPALARAAAPPSSIERLIDALASIKDSDMGYSPRLNASGFLPLHRQGMTMGGMLGGPPLKRSAVLEELVRLGPAALPHLVAHLGDKRRTGVEAASLGPLGGMFHASLADRNDRTQRKPRVAEEPSLPFEEGKSDGPFRTSRHVLTVGDLCFVALGQIVNRDFSAVRYRPTAMILVSSPTLSPSLRKQTEADWKGATEADLLASLADDFIRPDSESRRTGAAWRLAYWYPQHLEALALAFLRQETYPVFKCEELARQKLYKEKDAAKRRKLLDEFVAKHGETAREGVLLQLFDDLDTLEAHEQGRMHPPLTEFSTQPRTLLIELFGKDRKVKASDRPRSEALSDSARDRFISEALIHDDSPLLDRAILKLFDEAEDDLAEACLARLIGRGYDAAIEAGCKRRLAKMPKDKGQGFRRALARLGWTRLHVAVEQGRADRVRALLAKSPARSARDGTTPLHVAVSAGHADLVPLLAASRKGLDLKDGSGRTAAQIAAEDDDDDTARTLLAAGASPVDARLAALADRPDLLGKSPGKALTQGKRTPLHLAARWGNVRVLAALLDGKCDKEARDESGTTALHHAALSGQAEAIRVLLSRRADARATVPENMLQALHLAVLAGHRDAAEALIDGKAPVDAKAAQGATPLLVAIRQGKQEMAALLLSRGASPDLADEAKSTPLHRAIQTGNREMVGLLLRHKADPNATTGKEGTTALHLAAAAGDVMLVGRLLRVGARADAKESESGETPLHKAAEAGNGAVVRLLLDKKAAADARSKRGSTPLHSAAGSGNEALAEMLLRAGASATATDDDGRQPLHEAAGAGSPALVRLLLSKGADARARTKERDTPLHFAAASGNVGVARLLLEKKAEVDARNATGQTPLHASIRVYSTSSSFKIGDEERTTKKVGLFKGTLRMSAYLLQRGANPNAADGEKMTPLHKAAYADGVDLMRLLLSRKADPSAQDGEGRTPLDVAEQEKQGRAAGILKRFGKAGG